MIGCGYLGKRVAIEWLEAGLRVAVTTRSPERAIEFERAGFAPIVCDVTNSASLGQLPTAEVTLWAVGFDRTGSHSLRDVYVRGLEQALNQPELQETHLIHISSTSVYGQTEGSIVDEDSVCEPERENGQICLDAERVVMGRTGRSTILRLAGIYGPQRLLARAQQLQNQEPLAGNPLAWLNLIHVTDAVRAVRAVERSSDCAPLYLVSDDEPVTREDYYRELANVLQAPEPLFAPDLPDRKGDRGLNKRCLNQRLKTELLPVLQFPSMKTGLRDAVGR